MVSTIYGRWDVTVRGLNGYYPSWFEFTDEGGELMGRFVGRVGSARPMTEVKREADEFYFQLPPQYEKHEGDQMFRGRLVEGLIEGETNDEEENWVGFTGVPAPPLGFRQSVKWGEPIDLIQGEMGNWMLRFSDGPNGWKMEEGILSNTPPSVDIMTKEKFTDFKLHAEFRIPEKGNSGVYLRGRYEVQVVDDQNQEPGPLTNGSVYGFLTPSRRMTKPPMEWNSYDIILVGRWVTIVHNGETIVDNQEIPGLTGGALDSREGEPGPIMIQGDHKAVEYRNLVLRRSV
jgi:hypothetical protein